MCMRLICYFVWNISNAYNCIIHLCDMANPFVSYIEQQNVSEISEALLRTILELVVLVCLRFVGRKPRAPGLCLGLNPGGGLGRVGPPAALITSKMASRPAAKYVQLKEAFQEAGCWLVRAGSCSWSWSCFHSYSCSWSCSCSRTYQFPIYSKEGSVKKTLQELFF